MELHVSFPATDAVDGKRTDKKNKADSLKGIRTMLDLTFTNSVSTALATALTRAVNDSDVESFGNVMGDHAGISRLCRRAAFQLLFDLDGQTLLDLALQKLSVEMELQLGRTD